MENASKALLMAAGVLIAIMVASIFALLFSTMSEYTRSYEERKQTEELQAFNLQFEKYLQYKDDGTQIGVTAQDIVTVINLAKSYNEKMGYALGDLGYITVEVEGTTGTTYTQESNTESLNGFLKQYSYDETEKKIIRYIIKEPEKDGSGRINKITFKQENFF